MGLSLLGDAPRVTGDPVPWGSRVALGHIVCDRQLLIVEVDLPARRILTRRRDQLIGQPFLRYLDEHAVAAFDAIARQLATEGLGSTVSEVLVVPGRAEPLPVRITLTYVPAAAAGGGHDDGCMVLVLEPIKRSDAEPSAIENGAGDLAERSADLITRYVLWPEPGFTYVGPCAEDLLGYPPKAFYADPWLLHELIDEPDDVEQLQRIYEGQDCREPLLLHIRHRNGNLIVLEQRSTGIRDGEGRLLAVEAIARDVTAQVEEQERFAATKAFTRAVPPPGAGRPRGRRPHGGGAGGRRRGL